MDWCAMMRDIDDCNGNDLHESQTWPPSNLMIVAKNTVYTRSACRKFFSAIYRLFLDNKTKQLKQKQIPQ